MQLNAALGGKKKGWRQILKVRKEDERRKRKDLGKTREREKRGRREASKRRVVKVVRIPQKDKEERHRTDE